MKKKQKYYAVKAGLKTGMFLSWAECEKQVKGFSGAVYKSFDTEEEAKEYLNNTKKEILKSNSNRILNAYVDGSFDVGNRKYACGVVLLFNNKKMIFNEVGTNEDFVSMQNVAGELMGSMRAMDFAYKNLEHIDLLVIYHDYEGIAKWSHGDWKTNKDGTKAYKKYYDEISKELDIKFVKIKAHSGDKYNEEADDLARKALQGEVILPEEDFLKS